MKLLKKTFIGVLMLFLLAGGYSCYKGYRMYRQAVEAVPVEKKIEEILNLKNYTSYEELPETYVNAIIAVEDKRFRRHHGFDIISTMRAAGRNIASVGLVEGGSTITQQLSRIMYFSQEKKFSRKFAEIFVARDVEKLCSKDEILELYVNVIYFGSGYYGVHDACQGYFHNNPSEMNDYEATMLAGIPNAPSVYSPKVSPRLAEERRQQVLEAMVEAGVIEEGEIQ